MGKWPESGLLITGKPLTLTVHFVPEPGFRFWHNSFNRMNRIISLLLLTGFLYACGRGTPAEKPLFTLLSPTETGVTFTNTLTDTDELNILNYIYFYNGGGVAVGDVNNDGLPDLYFTANQLPNKLYLNRTTPGKGNLHFEDVTATAGVAGAKGWNTGVTMADVNGDGWLDLYVCQVNLRSQAGTNQLFINNGKPGVPTFTEQAATYGLAHRGYSTQAAFFDFDRDGDLDMYLLNHSLRAVGALGDTTQRALRDPEAGDKLYRNDHNHFVDISAEAGIRGSKLGYGLGVAVGDINNDGWPDIYVSNDFHENDYLYYNRGDGRGFREGITASMGHTSNFSMGSDLADFNNDAALDLVTLDMQPANEEFVKTSAGADSYDLVKLKTNAGFHYQYPRNALQLNQGNGPGRGRQPGLPQFSDIAPLAGVYATDWSWSALFSDLDNDGLKDLYITNGIARRPIDLDFFKYIADPAVQASLRQGVAGQRQLLIDKMPVVAVANFAFRNNGNLTFTDQATRWGLDQKGFSNGAAYADLDLDGDLDLVVNNIALGSPAPADYNQPAFIYRNETNTQLPTHHYLSVKLLGTQQNTQGIGAKVTIRAGSQTWYQELMPTRGFESSVEPILTFGLGTTADVDSITVVWPDGKYERLRHLKPNQRLTLKQTEARQSVGIDRSNAIKPLFADLSDQLNLYQHRENPYVDFYQEPLLPHKLSTEGPDMAVGDVNGDGLDDFFVGGAKDTAGKLMLQQPNGSFVATSEATWQTDRDADDVGAAFFDADGDGDLDLYVVSGGNEPVTTPNQLADRLYTNNGKGYFTKTTGQLPACYANGSCVKPADYDRDGDMDLFVGSRSIPGQYGLNPTSYLLRNDGKGHFTEQPFKQTFGVADVGMVTDAVWADVDRDNRPDLVVVGEWSPVRIFKNNGQTFREITGASGLSQSTGWWNSIVADDLDNDGDLDLVVGNLGLNSTLTASPQQPLRGYFKDIDGNGTLDEILAYYKAGKLYPVAGKDELSAQLVSLRKKFVSYHDFATSDFDGILSASDLNGAVTREVTTLASSVLLNQGNGTFTVKALPVEAQFSPVMAMLTGDFDHDGRTDILLAGNFFGAAPTFGRYDAGHGLLLRGNGRAGFSAVSPAKSGFWVTGECRDLNRLKTANGALMMITKNNGPIQTFRQTP